MTIATFRADKGAVCKTVGFV